MAFWHSIGCTDAEEATVDEELVEAGVVVVDVAVSDAVVMVVVWSLSFLHLITIAKSFL